jgi:hypothetical protein
VDELHANHIEQSLSGACKVWASAS